MARVLTLKESMALVERHHLPPATTHFAKDQPSLLKLAAKIRPPWVLKVSSPQAVHKTEKGLVVTHINTLEELRLAVRAMAKRTRGLDVDAYVLQEQRRGPELLIGAIRDPSFGHAIAFGSGGMLVEMFKDVSWRLAPLSPKDAREMIMETKASAFCKPGGFRGKHANINALSNLLLRTSRLLVRNPEIVELDFNPVITDARKALIVDARIVVEK